MGGSYVVGFGAQAVYFVLLTRTLGVQEYGNFTGAFALATATAFMSGLGAGNVLVMRVSRSISSLAMSFGTALAYIAMTALPLVVVDIVVGSVVGTRFLSVLIPLLVSELVFGRALDVAFQLHQALDRLRFVAMGTVTASLSRLAAIALLGHWVTSDAQAWAWCYALISMVLGVGATLASIRRFGRPKLSAADLRGAWRIGAFFSIGTAARSLLFDGDKFLMTALAGPVAAGEYAAASKVANVAFAPIQALVYSANTRLFRAGESGGAAVWVTVKRVLAVGLALSVLLSIGMLAIGSLVPKILGTAFLGTAAVIPWLVPTLVLQTIHHTVGDALMGMGEQKRRSLAQGVIALAAFGADAVVIPRYGWLGCAIVAIFAGLILALILSTFMVTSVRQVQSAARSAQAEAPLQG